MSVKSRDSEKTAPGAVPIVAMFKFGSERYMSELFERGVLFMQPATYFSRLESDGDLRRDAWEGYDFIGQPHKCKIKIIAKDGTSVEPELRSPIRMNRGWTRVPHIYSMSALTVEDAENAEGELLNPRLLEFGEWAVFIRDSQNFLQRFEDRCTAEALEWNYGLVEYFDENHHGELSPFNKSKRFRWQSEARLTVISREAKEPLRIEMGPLDGIATMMRTQDLLDGLQYDRTDDGE